MLEVQVRGDVQEHLRGLDRIDRRLVRTAIRQSISGTVTTSAAHARRKVAKAVKQPQKTVKKFGVVKVKRPSFQKLEGIVHLNQRYIGLSRLGLSARHIRRIPRDLIWVGDKGRGIWGEPFDATLRNNRTHAVYRLRKRIDKTKQSRGGSRKFYKSSMIAKAFLLYGNRRLFDQINNELQLVSRNRFTVLFDRNLQNQLRRHGLA